MSPELLIKLKDLVFSPRNPYLSLDNLLQPYLDLMAECERETIGRCARILETKAAASTAKGPMLVDDNDPDAARKLFAADIRALAPLDNS